MDKVIPTNGTSAEDIKYANTVKKVYIDGVDVSGCEFCSATGQCKIQQVFQRNEIVGIIEKPYGVHLECNLCDKDCYYKQLQRLERQYEDVLKLAKENADSNEYCLKELEQENEFLKKELEKHKSKIGYLLSPLTDSEFQNKLKELEQENEQLHNDLKECGIKREQYRQALQEIRDIAEYTYDPVDKDNDPCYSILVKINEVIGAE